MERLVIDIGLVIIALGFGYWRGYKACYEYTREELRKYRNELYKRNELP